MVLEEMRSRLIGALIGLARSTEGNEHLVNDGTASLVLAGLRAAASEDDAGMEEMLRLVTEEKRRMVPDCFYCACPCGRTSDYDLSQLQKLPEDLHRLKMQILTAITDAAASSNGYRRSQQEVFYLSLFAVGMEDWDADQLRTVLQRAENLKK